MELKDYGYPMKIKGNDSYVAYLKDIQPLGNGKYMGIYKYPGGECCHDLEEIERCFEVLE